MPLQSCGMGLDKRALMAQLAERLQHSDRIANRAQAEARAGSGVAGASGL